MSNLLHPAVKNRENGEVELSIAGTDIAMITKVPLSTEVILSICLKRFIHIPYITSLEVITLHHFLYIVEKSINVMIISNIELNWSFQQFK